MCASIAYILSNHNCRDETREQGKQRGNVHPREMAHIVFQIDESNQLVQLFLGNRIRIPIKVESQIAFFKGFGAAFFATRRFNRLSQLFPVFLIPQGDQKVVIHVLIHVVLGQIVRHLVKQVTAEHLLEQFIDAPPLANHKSHGVFKDADHARIQRNGHERESQNAEKCGK